MNSIVKNVDFKLDLYTKDKMRCGFRAANPNKVCEVTTWIYMDMYINNTKLKINSFENFIEIIKFCDLLEDFKTKMQELVQNFHDNVKKENYELYDISHDYYGDVNITYYSGNYLAIVITENGGIDNVVKRWEQFLEEFL